MGLLVVHCREPTRHVWAGHRPVSRPDGRRPDRQAEAYHEARFWQRCSTGRPGTRSGVGTGRPDVRGMRCGAAGVGCRHPPWSSPASCRDVCPASANASASAGLPSAGQPPVGAPTVRRRPVHRRSVRRGSPTVGPRPPTGWTTTLPDAARHVEVRSHRYSDAGERTLVRGAPTGKGVRHERCGGAFAA